MCRLLVLLLCIACALAESADGNNANLDVVNQADKCSEAGCVKTEMELEYEAQIHQLNNYLADISHERCNLSAGHWVEATNGVIPKGAVVSGWDPNRPYWVARAVYKGNVMPCKLTQFQNTCWMPWNNTEINLKKYEVLVGADTKWVPHTSSEVLPEKAVVGGRRVDELGREEKLYVGRDYIGAMLVPGYVYEFSRQLRHSSNYKNQLRDDYEILIYV